MTTTRKRRPKFKQYIPDGPEPMFAIYEPIKGANYWHASGWRQELCSTQSLQSKVHGASQC